MQFRISLLILLALIFTSCDSKETAEDEIVDTIEDETTVDCSNSEITITESDAIAIPDATDPIYWKGIYNETSVRVGYTKQVSTDGETESVYFVFKKVDACLTIDYAYKYYDGDLVDISAVTQINVSSFYTQDWESDTKFSGVVTYIDPHDKSTYTRKFWVTFTTDDFVEETNDFQYFSDCFITKLPLGIDVNKDNIIDFNLEYEEIINNGNTPSYSEYQIKLTSSNTVLNSILSPNKSSIPFPIIFEAPFTTSDAKKYTTNLKNTLDIFYEFDAPYEEYNYFLNNNQTYKQTLNNNKDDYFVVSMILNGQEHYGTIQFKLNTSLCSVEVIETYLNPVAYEHFDVN
jgi:hypothetical protein